MQIHEYSPAGTGILLSPPPLDKLKNESVGGTILGLLILGGIAGWPLYVFIARQEMTGLLLLALIFVPIFLLEWSAAQRKKRQHGFLKGYQFPSLVKDRVGKHYPDLTDEQLSLVMLGLRQYFILCNAAGPAMVSMPSQAVDAAWHEFILLTRAYEEFCKNGMGRFLHHTPAEALAPSAGTLEAGKGKAWLLACEWEGIDEKTPLRLPFLFAIDTALEIPDGFKHALDNNYADTASGEGGGESGCGGCGGCGGG